MEKSRICNILVLFCVLLFINSVVIMPMLTGSDDTDSNKKYSAKTFSEKNIDSWWKNWTMEYKNSSELRTTNETTKYHGFYQRKVNKNESVENWWKNYYKDKDQNGIDDVLDSKISRSSKNTVNITVSYDHHPTKDDIEILEGYGFKINYIAKYIDSVFIDNCSIEDLTKISNLTGVAMIEGQEIYMPYLDVSTKAIKARGSDDYNPNTVWDRGEEYEDLATGLGINIAILDTGVDDTHISLSGKYIAGYNAITEQEMNPDDLIGHGTHCAGIAMGKDSTYKGVAPDSKLIDVQVMSIRSTDSIIIKGIEWCIDNKNKDWDEDGQDDDDGIDVLSMSIGIGFPNNNSDGQDPLSRTCNKASDKGLVCVAAMGNDGRKHISQPAAADSVIAVGGTDDKNTITRTDDTMYSNSNYGPRKDDGDSDSSDELKPDVVAPGVNIKAPRHNTQYQFVGKTGTSMSTPHIAGLAALMLEANSELCPGQIKSLIRKTAEKKGTLYDSSKSDKYNQTWGFGYVDAYKAVKAAGATYDISGDSSGAVKFDDDFDTGMGLTNPTNIGYGMIKLKKPNGDNQPGGPNVYPSDTPVNTMSEQSTYIFDDDDYNDDWDSGEANGEIICSEGKIVASVTRIGENNLIGIGMSEPVLRKLDTHLYSPLLLVENNFESEIVLQNPTENNVDATVKFYYLDGTLADTIYITDLAPHASTTLYANDYLTVQSGNAEIIVTSGSGLVGITKRINTVTKSGMSEPLIAEFSTILYHHPLLVESISWASDINLNNPTSTTVYFTIDYYNLAGSWMGSQNLQIPSHSNIQIQTAGLSAKITVTSGSGLVGITIVTDSISGITMSKPLLSSSEEKLFAPYIEEIGSWDSYIVIHNPEETNSNADLEFYNLDGTIAHSETLTGITAHSTIIIEGDNYKQYWDGASANVKIIVTSGAELVGCISHTEPNYYIGFSTNLLTEPSS